MAGGEQGPAIWEDAVNPTEYRLQLLREDLMLAGVQQPLWDAYADKVSALAADISRERGRLRATLQLKALQRIDQSVDVACNCLTAPSLRYGTNQRHRSSTTNGRTELGRGNL